MTKARPGHAAGELKKVCFTMESSCEQILKRTEKVLNGGAITEEEARTLIRTAGGMNGVMIGNYLTSKGSDPQDDIAMLHDLGRPQTAPQV